MAKVISLHPNVRENVAPRLSAAALAEYLIMKPDQQETVLHNSRFSSSFVVAPHSEALVPIRAYCSDPARPKHTLTKAKEGLTAKSEDLSIRPKAREESLRCIETIYLFENAENAFGLGSMRLTKPSRFEIMNIEGVSLSVQPDLLISHEGSDGRQLCGTLFFRPQKAPDPDSCRLEETRRSRGEHRREMARYMLAMGHILIDENQGEYGRFDRDRSMVADIRMAEKIHFSTGDHAARVKAIKAACRQIKSLWPNIEPRKSALRKE